MTRQPRQRVRDFHEPPGIELVSGAAAFIVGLALAYVGWLGRIARR